MSTRKLPLYPMLLGMGLFACLAIAGNVTIAYRYDDAGRLVETDYDGGGRISYHYDANGNLLQRTVAADGAVTYTLVYRAGTGGSVNGVPLITQQVEHGQDGTAVTALVEDAAAVFARWSDGHTTPTRADLNVQADLDVTARFRSEGGADLDWYAARDIEPEGGGSWTEVDARAVPDKGTTLLHENITDTDPDAPADTFRILELEPGPPPVLTFRPGSPDRVYTLRATGDLQSGTWTNVPGAGPRRGEGVGDERQDAMTDSNAPASGLFYRLEVQLPD